MASSIAILGAGLAGTCLARSLVAAGFEGRIDLYDRRTDFSREQRWCSWGPVPKEMPVSASWKRWRVVCDGREAVSSLPERPYLQVYAPDFFRKFHPELAATPNVSLRLGTDVSGRIPAADLVFDATGPPRNAPSANGRARVALVQSFAGLVVRTERPVFDGTVTLMDFDPKGTDRGAGPLRFVYVLPFSGDHALVESTAFASRAVPGKDHLKAVWDHLADLGTPYRVEATERGAVPMTTGRPGGVRTGKSEGPFPVGVAGGAARASSGYALVEVLRESGRISDAVVRGENPAPRRTPVRQAVLDEVFLSVVRDRPELARRAFLDLFSKVPPDALVRFLSGESTLGDEVGVIRSLPKAPFAGAALGRLAAHALNRTVPRSGP